MALADGYDSRQYFRVSGFVFQIFAATFTFFASEAFVRWAKENGKFARTINHMVSLGGYSFGIYLNHYVFLILMLYLFEYLSAPTAFWIRFSIVLPSILLLSWAAVKIFTLGPLRRIYPILYG
jgi:peptidoglycan/LPS O-acetylase OafA/YrhL